MAVAARITGWTRRPLRPQRLLAKHQALQGGSPVIAWNAADHLVDSLGRAFTLVGTAGVREANDGPESFASGTSNRIELPNFSPPTAACTVILTLRPQASCWLLHTCTANNSSGIRISLSATLQVECTFGDGAGAGSGNRRTYVTTPTLTAGEVSTVVISFTRVTSGYININGQSAAFSVTGTATNYAPGAGNGMLHASYLSSTYSYGPGESGLLGLIVLPQYTQPDLGAALALNPWQVYARREEHVYNFTGVPEITALTPADTSVAVQWSGLADQYRIDGGTATALPDGTSPDIITGLTVNTEYNAPGLQLRYLSGDWSAAVPFGTTNPGSGEGEIESPTFNAAWARGSNIILQG